MVQIRVAPTILKYPGPVFNRTVAILEIYLRPCPYHGHTSSRPRTLIVWKQSLEPLSTDLLVWKMERVKGGSKPLASANK